jgi:hypothetical protein
MSLTEQKDLIVLVADKDARLAMQGILSRHQSLGIRPISYSIEQHPDHDGGCRTKGVSYLHGAISLYSHALLIFDHEGCGQEETTASDLEIELDEKLNDSGWSNRAHTLIIEPELDVWVWSDSPHVLQALGWNEDYAGLKARLSQQGLWNAGELKPRRPKESMEWVLRQSQKVRSSAIYGSIAGKITFRDCQDRCFGKRVTILQEWFSAKV